MGYHPTRYTALPSLQISHRPGFCLCLLNLSIVKRPGGGLMAVATTATTSVGRSGEGSSFSRALSPSDRTTGPTPLAGCPAYKHGAIHALFVSSTGCPGHRLSRGVKGSIEKISTTFIDMYRRFVERYQVLLAILGKGFTNEAGRVDAGCILPLQLGARGGQRLRVPGAQTPHVLGNRFPYKMYISPESLLSPCPHNINPVFIVRHAGSDDPEMVITDR